MHICQQIDYILNNKKAFSCTPSKQTAKYDRPVGCGALVDKQQGE